jgi:hypothetical protein
VSGLSLFSSSPQRESPQAPSVTKSVTQRPVDLERRPDSSANLLFAACDSVRGLAGGGRRRTPNPKVYPKCSYKMQMREARGLIGASIVSLAFKRLVSVGHL